jgi:ABC-type nitrate/sulfonate/bicarbonate transport system ATPase subunit
MQRARLSNERAIGDVAAYSRSDRRLHGFKEWRYSPASSGRRVATRMGGAVPKLELRGLTHVFNAIDGQPAAVLEDISIAIPNKKFVCVLGPSGCGKSTLFNIVAGLLKPSQGEVYLDSEKITGMVGCIGYMLQKDLLLPWRTVLDNVILGMELQGMSKAQARERALPYFARYGLGGYERQYPPVLSGGMRQRAALLRTLLYDSQIILLDEPFAALDAQTRSTMQEWLLQIWADFEKTVVFITHDVEEAVYLSDEIFVMTRRPGRLKAVIDVPMGRPRRRGAIDDGDFVATKRKCLELLTHQGSQPSPDGADAR